MKMRLAVFLTLLLVMVAHPVGSIGAQVEPWSCDQPLTPAPSASPVVTEVPTIPEAVPFPAEGGSLTVFAAASLTDAFTKMAEDIKFANPAIEITFNFAGSQALVTQISEGGAEADVLALASPGQMTGAVEAGIPAETSTIFVKNQLTIVVPADNPAEIASLADLGNDGVKLVLANADVPAGDYARQAICKAEAVTAGVLGSIAGNVVSEEDNVRAVLAKVELGEADAGIVYFSDALTSGEAVTSVEIPADLNVVASYPIAAISDNPNAAAFIGYVFSPEGQATLAAFGFKPVG